MLSLKSSKKQEVPVLKQSDSMSGGSSTEVDPKTVGSKRRSSLFKRLRSSKSVSSKQSSFSKDTAKTSVKKKRNLVKRISKAIKKRRFRTSIDIASTSKEDVSLVTLHEHEDRGFDGLSGKSSPNSAELAKTVVLSVYFVIALAALFVQFYAALSEAPEDTCTPPPKFPLGHFSIV